MRTPARGLLILAIAATLVVAFVELRRSAPSPDAARPGASPSGALPEVAEPRAPLAPAPDEPQQRMAQAGGALEPPCVVGVVHDAAGRAVANARVTLFQPRALLPGIVELGARLGSARTDAEGRFVVGLPLAGAGYLMRAQAAEPGGGRAAAELRGIDVAAEHPTLIAPLVLPRACTLAGTIRDVDGRPVAGAAVAIEPGGAETLLGAEPEQVVRSDERGDYRADGLAPGEKDLRVRAAGHAFAGRTGIVVRAGEAVEGVDFALERERLLRGRVVAPDGRPIAGVRIDAYSWSEEPSAAEVAFEGWGEGTSAANGGFVVHGLAPGRYLLELGAEGWQTRQAEVPSGGELDLRVEMQPLASLSGRVLAAESGRPLAAFALELVSAGTSTPSEHADPEGRFRVTAPLAPVLLRASAPGRLPAELGPIDLAHELARDGIEFRLQAGPALQGSVVDERGVAWVGLRLRLVPDAASGLADGVLPQRAQAAPMATSDAAGAFTFAQVAPGAYRVLPADADVAFVAPPRFLVGGAPHTLPTLTALAAGALEGSVRDASGAPAANRLVELTSRGTPLHALSDEHGRFRLAGLLPGEYTLTLADGEARRERVQIEPGRTATITLAIP